MQQASLRPDMHTPVRAALTFPRLLAGACDSGGGQANDPSATPRTWAMGFSPTPPVLTVESVLQGVDAWTPRSEFAVFHEELPWTDLLAGMLPADILLRDKSQLVALLRQRGQRLAFMLDLTDGLSRAEEAPQLRTLGRSLAEPAVQQLARDYALAVATMLEPDLLGLAAETNLIRLAAPAPIYQAVVTTANAIAADLEAATSPAMKFVSVQVETAWGLLQAGPFVGIEQDLADFPFAQAIGLSSYPYFVFGDPADIPDDYYARVLEPTALPAFVAEGGWSSVDVGGGNGSEEAQARFVGKQAALLDGIGAIAWLHLLFADPDLRSWPQPIPSNLPLFTSIGYAHSDFAGKPALGAWDQQFARPWSGW